MKPTRYYRVAQMAKQILSEKEPPVNPKLKGFVTNIEEDTITNKNFRKVLYTGKHSQLVLMVIKPKDDIGEEVHDVDQFFRIDSGSGKVIINGNEQKISDGFAIVIPAGAKHNIINDGTKDLKLYTIYSPPHHEDKIVRLTKEDAKGDTESFKGVTTE
jgi:mannose-6-phosphate isomerase-like protein (cupin superfamily)